MLNLPLSPGILGVGNFGFSSAVSEMFDSLECSSDSGLTSGFSLESRNKSI